MKSVPSAPQEAALGSNKQNRSNPSHTNADQRSSLYDDADLYDCIAWGNCEAFYFDAASRCGGPVLELACGTGRMLVPMAKAGLDVTGLDVFPVMLAGAHARARHLGTSVRVATGDMRAFLFPQRFALVFVAVNSLLHLTSTQDLRSCFASVRNVLHPDGRFVFDIYNFAPSRLARLPDRRYQVGCYMSPVHGSLLVEELCHYDAATQLLHRAWFYSAPSRPDFRMVEFAMRVVFPEELQILLELEGLRLEARHGDLGRSPFHSGSRSQVCSVRPA